MGVSKPFSFGEKGQTLLIVVLIMVVGVTVGLSLVARSITNLRVANDQATSQQALAAAEAGAEEALQALQAGQSTSSNIGTQTFTENRSQITSVTVDPIIQNPFLVQGGSIIEKNDGADVWLSDYPTYDPQWGDGKSGNLTIYWGTSNDSSGCSAALEIDVLSGSDKNNPTLTRYAYDSCATTRSNNFSTSVDPGDTIEEVTFSHSVALTITNGFFLRIIPLYQNTILGVKGDTQLPSQGYVINSTGQSLSTTRKVTVVQGYPEIPVELFPYSYFSP